MVTTGVLAKGLTVLHHKTQVHIRLLEWFTSFTMTILKLNNSKNARTLQTANGHRTQHANPKHFLRNHLSPGRSLTKKNNFLPSYPPPPMPRSRAGFMTDIPLQQQPAEKTCTTNLRPRRENRSSLRTSLHSCPSQALPKKASVTTPSSIDSLVSRQKHLTLRRISMRTSLSEILMRLWSRS